VPYVAWQPWEYSRVPEKVGAALALADEVWACSAFTRDAFLRSGLDPAKVQVVGYGADPHVFTPDGPPEPLQPNGLVRFLAVGGTIYRKGVDVLRAAFARAFGGDPALELVVKDSGVGTFYEGSTAHVALAEAAQRGELRYISEDWDERRLAGLFRACDVLVAPYRGEGFCLPALEALASARPVIATVGGGSDEFLDDRVGWRVTASPRSVGRTIFGMAVDGEAFLLEPDVEVLSDALRAAARDARERRERGCAGRERVLERWTWRHVAARVLARLDARFGTQLVGELAALSSAVV
jgi:glycosyltransferase involved in cell wall biosynthesis